MVHGIKRERDQEAERRRWCGKMFSECVGEEGMAYTSMNTAGQLGSNED